MSDNVEHPSHYNAGGVETIEGIKAALGDGFSDYCLGNVLKYVWRCKHKGKLLEDLCKAAKYLEWAIEEAEGNCLKTPDSSSGKAIPIPSGWRELEPDEMPLATDMHEWMGGWLPRKDDATNTYIWHSARHVRKIETLKPEPLAIPEGWRELEADEMPKVTDLYENEGVWRNRINDSSIEYARYESRHIRKIETDKPEHVECVWVEEAEEKRVFTLDEIEELIDKQIAEQERIKNEKEEADANASRKIETENTSQTPNSSIPDPGPGYRLLSKHPPEQVIRGDEFWNDLIRKWVESENFMHEGGPQAPELYYRRKIEPAAWIPKVGDKVRVNKPGRIAHGKVGVIVEANACEFAVRLDVENLTSFNLKAEHLELIEAAS